MSYRPFILGLAPVVGLMLGWPALTSQPASVTPASAPAAPRPFEIPASAVPAMPPGAATPYTTAPYAAAPLAPAPAASPLSAPAASPAPPALASAVTVPPAPVLLALLRGSLAAVNQANITGNYSVLRDLGAPAFREERSVAELADQFRPWRDNALDFAAVLLLDAKLSRPPTIGKDGMLRLAGYFPTAPLRIEFDLGYQAVGGNWRLAAIALEARHVEPATASVPAAPANSPATPAKVAALRPAPAPAASTPGAPAPFDMGALLPVGSRAY
ncbi:hypothetical protein GCM10028812_14880 [Ancylobacter sonchi]